VRTSPLASRYSRNSASAGMVLSRPGGKTFTPKELTPPVDHRPRRRRARWTCIGNHWPPFGAAMPRALSRPLYRLHASGIAAAGDDTEIAARLGECLRVDVRPRGRRG